MSDDNNIRLKELMKTYGLTLEDVSAFTDYSLDMVKAWTSKPGSRRYRTMQDRALRLLKFEIEDRGIQPKI